MSSKILKENIIEKLVYKDSKKSTKLMELFCIFYNTISRNYLVKILPKYRNFMMTTEAMINIQNFLFSIDYAGVLGDVIELGCNDGITAILISKNIETHSNKRKLFLYDSFQGLTDFSEQDKNLYLKKGDCITSLSELNNNFAQYNAKYDKVIYGNVLSTIPKSLPKRIAFAHIDLDLYKPTRHVLKHILPRMTKKGIIVFDDYGNPCIPGVEKAVKEILGQNLATQKIQKIYAGSYPLLNGNRPVFNGKQITQKYQAFLVID